MKTALFIVDHRQEAGRGHIVRCEALAYEVLLRRGWRVEIEDSRRYPTAAKLPKHDVLIVDDYNLGGWEHGQTPDSREWLYQAVDYSPFVVLVDDYQPERIPDGVGIVVNGSASGESVAYAPSIRALRGPKYALLRSEFSRAPDRTYGREGTLDMTTIRGLTAFQLATVLAHSLWAVSHGGMSALEAVACGTPVRIAPDIASTKSEYANRDALVAARCAIRRREDTDGADWDEMHKECLALTDGLGCTRVADAIEEYIA